MGSRDPFAALHALSSHLVPTYEAGGTSVRQGGGHAVLHDCIIRTLAFHVLMNVSMQFCICICLQRRSTRTLHRTWGSSTMYHQDRRCRR